MSEDLGRLLDHAITGTGTVRVERQGATAEVEVVEADRLAVRILRVRVSGESTRGVRDTAARLPDACRGLPERIVPVEVAPELGGAVLRSAPRDVVDREYFEVRTDGKTTDIERIHAAPGVERHAVPFTLTREALARIVGKVAG